MHIYVNSGKRADWRNLCISIGGALAMTVFVGIAPAGSGSDLKQTAMNYLESKGQDAQNMLRDQLEAELENSNIGDLSLGVTDFGGALFGDPALAGQFGAIAGIFKGILDFTSGGSTASTSDPVTQALLQMDKRLRQVEANVAKLNTAVDQLTLEDQVQNNRTRLDALLGTTGTPPITTQIQNFALKLSPSYIKQMSEADKVELLDNILILADGFVPDLPESTEPEDSGTATIPEPKTTDIWAWDNIVVSKGGPPGPKLRRVVVRSINLALQPYLETLALFVSARRTLNVGINCMPGDNASKDDATIRKCRARMYSRLRRHVAFLTGTHQDLKTYGVKFSLLGQSFVVRCAWGLDAGSAGFSCSSPLSEKTSELAWSADTVPVAVVQREFDTLEAQLRDELGGTTADRTTELIKAAATALSGENTLVAYKSSAVPGHFSMAHEIIASDTIYAVDAGGRLHQFVHEIAKIDTFAKEDSAPKTEQKPWRIDQAFDPGKLQVLQHSDDPPDVTHPSDPNSRKANASVKDKPGGVQTTEPSSRSKHTGVDTPATENHFERYKIAHDFFESEKIAGNWNAFSAVIPSQQVASGFVIYGLTPSGKLIWRRIDNHEDDNHPGFLIVLESPSPPNPVGTGWNTMSNVFSTGEGIVYGVAANGDLVWYHHINNAEGYSVPPQWAQHSVGNGWGGFAKLFSTGKGVIYAVRGDGTLVWYRHTGYLDGTKVWSGPRQVGTGWNMFQKIFAGPDGDIYAINAKGELFFYKHKDWQIGLPTWETPVKLADGWGSYAIVFAAMGYAGNEPPFQGPN